MTRNEKFERWHGVLGWGGLTAALWVAFGMTVASPGLMFITIPAFFLGAGAAPFLGIAIYTVVALNYADYYRNNNEIPDYHKELRRLKRQRAKHSRALLSNKGWGSLQRSAYDDLVTVDKMIAEHTGETYVAPARKVNRY